MTNNSVIRNFLLKVLLFSLMVPFSAAAASKPGKTASRLPGAFTDPTTGMEFVLVKGGCFQMGEEDERDARHDEKPAHKVCVDSFYIGKYVVTQSQWENIMESNPSYFKACGQNCPVESVNWDTTQDFITRLNTKSGKKFRLPTEAEWEYVARSGGKKERFSGITGGKRPDSVAWYRIIKTDDSIRALGASASDETTHPVGQKQPNGLGLYDMSGNVWEWVNDWYSNEYYGISPKKNPQGPSTGTSRVLRGGSWADFEWFARTTTRNSRNPRFGANQIGFRLVVTAK